MNSIASSSSSSSALVVGLAAALAAGLVLGKNWCKLKENFKAEKKEKKEKTPKEREEIKRRIADVTPYYKYKGIDRFYDISGFLLRPEVFQLVVDEFVQYCERIECDSICGIDARGFIFGPPIALALNKPFFMVRKANKLPSCHNSQAYRKEYKDHEEHDGDTLSVPVGAVSPGQRVVCIDDLIATGGSVQATLDLLTQLGAKCVGVACVIEIQVLNARERLRNAGHANVDIFSIVEEDLLHLDGETLSA